MSTKEARKHVTLFVLLLLTCSVLKAQDYDPNGRPRESVGPTASELISGSSTSLSGMVKFDTAVGWNFTKNFSMDVGVPYLFNTRPGIFTGTANRPGYVSSPYIDCTFFFGCYTGIATSSRIWAGELGDVYAEARYTRPYKKYNFATNLTGDFPTASFHKGLTTGRTQWDWFNHIDTDIHGFDPFVNFGLANGRMDQHFLPRPFNTNLPFRTLGYLSDFEGGVQYKAFRRVNIGFSVWDVLPMGAQRIYSNIVWSQPGASVITVGTGGTPIVSPFTGSTLPPATAPGSIGVLGYTVGDPNHGRYWNTAFETVGPAYITRDNGYSATLAFSPFKYMDVMVGYNHSVRYALDGVVVTLAFNANALARKLTNY